MAKGDQATAQEATSTLGKQAGDSLQNTGQNVNTNMQTMQSQFQAPYLNSLSQQGNDYSNIMGQYNQFLNRSGNYAPTNQGGFGGRGPIITQPIPGGTTNPGPVPGGPIGPLGGNTGYSGGLNLQGGVQSPGGQTINQNPAGMTFNGMGGYQPSSGAEADYGWNGAPTQLGSLSSQQLGNNFSTQGNQTGRVPGATQPGQMVDNGMGNIYSGGSPSGGTNPTQGSPSANTGGPKDYQSIYNQIMGGANDQASLVKNAGALQAAGIQLSPANANGEISKIGIPDGNGGTQWVRVIGAGEGHSVWIPQNSSGAMSGGGSYEPAINSALAGYQNFATTGGFSPQDIADMRARSTAPIRGIYDQANQELQRSKSLNNGVSPNFAAAQSQMARQQSNNTANQLQSTDASIAGLRQQGQLSGLSGLSQTGLLGRGQDLSNYQTLRGQDLTNAQVGRGQDLSAIQGMGSLYGTAPGAAGMFGNQYLQAGLGNSQSQINLQQLLNNLNLGLIGANQTNATIPSTAQNVLQNVSWGVNTAGKVMPMMMGMA